ncbi:hypothetical protein A2Z67_01465 [Candidatus Woesebacteria bacterium RBG_13_36_22]|uniref:SHOCT domain-containing protein n=1 Tax=Candidatus Woesebacteria bacterium RBG_13_36_22 TaxID=1802478 RepID=A0A1F7WZQ4_9BACT|nr:MAG: hypothetical protein A2Z67_01465 [Candidatus Woesebacteria bacterium RBG_13_36_22]
MHYWAQPYGREYGFGGGSFMGFLFMVVFWAAVAFIFIMLIKGFYGHKHVYEHGKDEGDIEDVTSDKPLNILKERYAKGEINKKEFDEIKKDIS